MTKRLKPPEDRAPNWVWLLWYMACQQGYSRLSKATRISVKRLNKAVAGQNPAYRTEAVKVAVITYYKQFKNENDYT